MSGSHDHDEKGHSHEGLGFLPRRQLVIALALTASFLVVEVAAGIFYRGLDREPSCWY